MQKSSQRRIKLLDLSIAESLVKEMLVPDTKLIARLVLRQKGKIFLANISTSRATAPVQCENKIFVATFVFQLLGQNSG